MSERNYRPIFYLVTLAGLFYFIHKILFYVLGIEQEQFFYSLESLYLIFLVLSVLVLLILLKVKEKSFDNIGMSFLLITSVKMILVYIVLRPILNLGTQNTGMQKINFFTLFILFLTIETVLTIRLLGNKQ